MPEVEHIEKVKTCRQPDKVCLQGGCVYCDDGTYKTVSWMRQYAVEHGWLEDFEYGFRSGWPNRKKKP